MTLAEVRDIARAILTRAGMDEHGSDVLANLVMRSERDGPRSHGLRMLPVYVQSFRSGYANPEARPAVEHRAPGLLRGNGDNGYYQIARQAATAGLIAAARENGVAAFTCANCHHLGALRFDTEPLAEAGLVALGMVNSMSMVVPHGGKRPVFGTNPISFAAPRIGTAPIVWDQATSVVALMDVKMAAAEGHNLPCDGGLDPQGNPSQDPNAILESKSLLPFGEHKGSAIGLMVEIMGAALAGGTLAIDNADRAAHGGLNVKGGATLIAMDPGRFGNPAFNDYVSRICAEIDGNGDARVPGDGRLSRRAKAEISGVALSDELMAQLTGLT
ncbi:MAG: Ldh family oxidoreductase [Rhodobacteraceae bacterium]|nr:Ldh family oxidoreductase [Paracoccaceae bacterium]